MRRSNGRPEGPSQRVRSQQMNMSPQRCTARHRLNQDCPHT